MTNARVDITTGFLTGEHVSASRKLLSQLEGVFQDEKAWQAMDPGTVVYEVQTHAAVADGTRGGLLFGTSCVMPGKVGSEYFMTRGHFHAQRESAEYYWCIQGQGALILMDEQGRTTVEWMSPGSLHYIPGHVAHRLANTGCDVLRVGACWPSDAGHDYAAITDGGFTSRLMEVDGKPCLVAAEDTEKQEYADTLH